MQNTSSNENVLFEYLKSNQYISLPGKNVRNGMEAMERIGYYYSNQVVVLSPVEFQPFFGNVLTSMKNKSMVNVDKNVTKVDIVTLRNVNHILENEFSNVFTLFISSNQLIPLIPTMFRLNTQPIVVHVAVVSNVAGRLVSDHMDLMAIRESGFLILASLTEEECHDMAILAHCIARKCSMPVLHFYDGFLTENLNLENGQNWTLKQLAGYFENVKGEMQVDEVKENDVNYNIRRNGLAAEKMRLVPEMVQSMLSEFPNSHYRAMEYYGDVEAEFVIVLIGSSFGVVKNAIDRMQHSSKLKVAVIAIRVYRPFHGFVDMIPESVKRIAVLDRCSDVMAAGDPLYLDVLSAMAGYYKKVPIVSGSYGMHENEHSEFHYLTAQWIFEELASNTLQHGFQAIAMQSANKESKLKLAQVVKQMFPLEKPYLYMLEHSFTLRLMATNLMNQDSVYGNAKFEKVPLNKQFGIDIKVPSSDHGFGMHLSLAKKRSMLEMIIQKIVANSLSTNPLLRETLEAWLKANENDEDLHELNQKIRVLVADIDISTPDENIVFLMQNIACLPKLSHWIVGTDAWSDDISASGLHQVLASGENINILILDTEPYSIVSDEIDQRKRTRRKKDIGLYAMNYGNAYVASVAMYDSYSNVLRAFHEADAFHGPSIVIAYAPKMANVSEMTKETQLAIDSGYWPMYRWDPSISDETKRFLLDSEHVKAQLKAFLDRENQLFILANEKVEIVQDSEDTKLNKLLTSTFDKLTTFIEKESEDDSSKKELLVLFGSDNGRAEEFATELHADIQALYARQFKITTMAMNDYAVETLANKSSMIVLFLCSTAGQGEFPTNAKDFFTDLNTIQDLSKISYSVFGLGDKHYWTGENEEHYFCKAPIDLDNKLSALGATRLADLYLGDDQDQDGPTTKYEPWKEKVLESIVPDGGNSIVLNKKAPKLTNEDIKLQSNFLRGTLMEGLEDRSTASLSESDGQLTKFHGIYQQDNRDLRQKMREEKKEKAFSFMIRVRVPGGISTPLQYLAIDDLAGSHANGNIKVTTRQAYQLQGILKWDLRGTVQGINRALMDSLAACGDVNRNVMANPNPDMSSIHREIWDISKDISAHLTPQTSAYHEIWLNKKIIRGGEGEKRDAEPLYGEAYLPRKFKIAIAIPPSNDVDVLAHCLGFIAIINEKTKKLDGFNVTVGGGMGMTHGNKATFPRLADVMGFCTPEQAKLVAEKVMLVQRDHGDRINRKHARFKYTVEDHGLDWIQKEVETRLGFSVEPPRPYKFTFNGDRFGWHKGVNSTSSFTLFVEGGRIKDTETSKVRTALREIAETLIGTEGDGDIRLTANQNVIVGNLNKVQAKLVSDLLDKYNLSNSGLSGLRLNSIACAALPFCGLALSESERYLPSLIGKLDKVLDECNLHDEAIVIRMTGCPNGCGRPYLGEIGFVGRAPGIYNVYLGAGFAGERLNKLYKESLNEDAILKELTPILHRFAKEKQPNEKFGDFVIRKKIVNACDASPIALERAAGDTFHAK